MPEDNLWYGSSSAINIFYWSGFLLAWNALIWWGGLISNKPQGPFDLHFPSSGVTSETVHTRF